MFLQENDFCFLLFSYPLACSLTFFSWFCTAHVVFFFSHFTDKDLMLLKEVDNLAADSKGNKMCDV